MIQSDILNIRLAGQQLVNSGSKTPGEVVARMGAMQAQDYNMSKWAIGIRLPGSTENDIEAAINRGEVIRTHLMRPTWHLVAAEDIHWLLELTAARVRSAIGTRDKDLELDETIYIKSQSIMAKLLDGEKHLTREEIGKELLKQKIVITNNRLSHIMMRAELDKLVCSGTLRGKKQTYALLDQRVSKPATYHKDEALAKLAQKYFTSHGPATIQDFVWWSGLSLTGARHAIEMIKSGFIQEKIEDQVYWFSDLYSGLKPLETSVHLLPAFDEFIISYRDRQAILSLENHRKAISNNGIFKPVVIRNGEAVGIWKKVIRKGKPFAEVDYFITPDKDLLEAVKKKSSVWEHFLLKK